jgi:hypothetical protein
MREFQQISSLPAINANVMLSVCERTPSVGGNNTVEEAYNYVFNLFAARIFKNPVESIIYDVESDTKQRISRSFKIYLRLMKNRLQ